MHSILNFLFYFVMPVSFFRLFRKTMTLKKLSTTRFYVDFWYILVCTSSQSPNLWCGIHKCRKSLYYTFKFFVNGIINPVWPFSCFVILKGKTTIGETADMQISSVIPRKLVGLISSHNFQQLHLVCRFYLQEIQRNLCFPHSIFSHHWILLFPVEVSMQEGRARPSTKSTIR